MKHWVQYSRRFTKVLSLSLFIVFCATASFSKTALAQTKLASDSTIRIASWNLGWHIAQAELPAWITQCAKTYQRNPEGLWQLSKEPQAIVGWTVGESRARIEGVDLSVMPPCNVYQTPRREAIAVTDGAWRKRNEQIARTIQSQIQPDVIAFQEVSGVAAVREALGEWADQYQICSFDGRFKLQRLAFAWKKSFGQSLLPCATVDAIALAGASKTAQLRPGYIVTLRINQKTVRILNLHLKSSCVSPADLKVDDNPTGKATKKSRRGTLDDPSSEHCRALQQQIAPLETSIETLSKGVDYFIVLGDFNRNLWHEAIEITGAEAVRSDGSRDLTKPLGDLLTRNLLKEVNDGEPATSKLTLIELQCLGDARLSAICNRAKTSALSATEQKVLTAQTGLGCRNAIGLDHFLVSDTLAPLVINAQKIPIGLFGQSRAASEFRSDPLLAISDHCPIVMTVQLK